MGIASGLEPIRARMKVRLEDRPQHQQRRHLHHPAFDRRYAQRYLAAVAFGNENATHRRGPIGLGFHFRLQGVQPNGHPGRTANRRLTLQHVAAPAFWHSITDGLFLARG